MEGRAGTGPGPRTPTDHDDVVPGEAIRKFADVAPVGGLLAGDQDVRGADVHGEHVRGQGGGGDVGLQQLHPLQPSLQDGSVDGLQRRERLLQDSIHQVDGAILQPTQGPVLALLHPRVGFRNPGDARSLPTLVCW